ncbi:MAG: ribokinase [Pseudomonadota bacterium]
MIYNLGSINADYFYSVRELPRAGETLAANTLDRDLGGKGANMSVAAARAGGRVRHIGAVGEDGVWVIDAFRAAGVETDIAVLPDVPTGHAVILREMSGENAIITLAGANNALDRDQVLQALRGIGPGDVFLFQNETNQIEYAAKVASDAGAHILYAAAPFCERSVRDVLSMVDTLVLNSVEMDQMKMALGAGPDALGVSNVIVTEGARGAHLFQQGADVVRIPAPKVDVVDTTGAGDTLSGFLAEGLDAERPIEHVLHRAICAASIMTTKKGTASAIPSLDELEAFELRNR